MLQSRYHTRFTRSIYIFTQVTGSGDNVQESIAIAYPTGCLGEVATEGGIKAGLALLCSTCRYKGSQSSYNGLQNQTITFMRRLMPSTGAKKLWVPESITAHTIPTAVTFIRVLDRVLDKRWGLTSYLWQHNTKKNPRPQEPKDYTVVLFDSGKDIDTSLDLKDIHYQIAAGMHPKSNSPSFSWRTYTRDEFEVVSSPAEIWQKEEDSKTYPGPGWMTGYAAASSIAQERLGEYKKCVLTCPLELNLTQLHHLLLKPTELGICQQTGGKDFYHMCRGGRFLKE